MVKECRVHLRGLSCHRVYIFGDAAPGWRQRAAAAAANTTGPAAADATVAAFTAASAAA
jgi:hypothetical protein